MTKSSTKKEIVDALCNQEIIKCNKKAAIKLAKVANVQWHEPETKIITQKAFTNELYFILKGEVFVKVEGRVRAIRKSGQLVGEMAAVKEGNPRSADIITKTKCQLARVEAEEFITIANDSPDLWRNIAACLADRLLQRNTFERPKNETSQLFIASSKEGIPVMNKVSDILHQKFNGKKGSGLGIFRWDKNVFHLSGHTMESLEAQAKKADFAIAIFGKDDKLVSRKQSFLSPRDNVVFEAGLFMGALERKRVFILKHNKAKLPSDLFGITVIPYHSRTKFEDVLEEVIAIIEELGAI